jgi:ABC-type iron transport system FetAB ATPase subunit
MVRRAASQASRPWDRTPTGGGERRCRPRRRRGPVRDRRGHDHAAGGGVSYPTDGVPAVSGLDLELAPGRPGALAGPSGSGKTAAVLALLRFIDIAAGEVTINGADARAMPPERLRALLAWSPEQPVLFPAALRANLRLGAPRATDSQMADLLADLGLGPWLAQLPDGLDTVLAPWGHPVSGGELQRLGVARAVLADRPVLLLDEPTSHLDPATAEAVLATVLALARDRSLLWVSHRREELAAFPVFGAPRLDAHRPHQVAHEAKTLVHSRAMAGTPDEVTRPGAVGSASGAAAGPPAAAAARNVPAGSAARRLGCPPAARS